MTAEDWLAGSTKPSPETSSSKPSSSKVRDIYAKEIEPLIRELLPKASEISFPSFALRRGPGGPNPFYGFGVHQDYGLYPEDMKTTYKTAYADLEGSFRGFSGAVLSRRHGRILDHKLLAPCAAHGRPSEKHTPGSLRSQHGEGRGLCADRDVRLCSWRSAQLATQAERGPEVVLLPTT